MNEPDLLTPSEVLDQVAHALPENLRANVIIVGSLAAGYHFFAGDGAAAIRTKDIDCLFSPHAKAVAAAVGVTEQLLKAQWTPRQDAKWGEPGKPGQAVEDLPMVRLKPPTGRENPGHWYLELLSAPPEYEPGAAAKKLQRVQTTIGDFAICSFDFLALAECEPLPTKSGVRIARPEMMALANMLHHPAIGDALIADTDYRRSNKDLGRVLVLAHLTAMRDRRDNTEELGQWPTRMWAALQSKFGAEAGPLGARAGDGIVALLSSEQDLAQALRIANLGLLASMDVGLEAIRATGRRLQAEVLEPLAELSRVG
jgi:hypothetical protein